MRKASNERHAASSSSWAERTPAVVAADADLERTASGLVWGAFANAGQACGSIERVYAVRSVADELVERVVARTRRSGRETPSPRRPTSGR